MRNENQNADTVLLLGCDGGSYRVVRRNGKYYGLTFDCALEIADEGPVIEGCLGPFDSLLQALDEGLTRRGWPYFSIISARHEIYEELRAAWDLVMAELKENGTRDSYSLERNLEILDMLEKGDYDFMM